MFHTNLPELTITDRLRWSDAIVLARDNGKYEFEAVKALRGDLTDVEIPFLADTSTVRRLTLNPDDAVLFAHDPNIGEWQRVAYVDDAMRPVVTELLTKVGTWPLEYERDRFEFFAALHDHPDNSIRHMAHLELDNAPYALLRTLDLRLEPETIIGSLRDLNNFQWVPFKYLLLGISGEDVAREQLNRAIVTADRLTQSGFLGSAATALIEIDGLQGLARLQQLFLDDPDQPVDKVEQIVRAMAIHNQVGSAELRARIGGVFSKLVRNQPETGPIVAKYLADSNDWSQAGAMEDLLKSRRLRSPSDIITVTTYLALAKQARAIE